MKIPFGPTQKTAFASIEGMAHVLSKDGTEARFIVPGRTEVVNVQVITSGLKGAELHLIPERSLSHKALAEALGYRS